jgi:vacuolar-type H+-ATPase subunit I/STV1
MKLKKTPSFSFFVLTLFLSACNNISTETESKEMISLISPYKDSIAMFWDSLKVDDSIKISNIKRLLQEISYCKEYDEVAVAKLNEEIKSIEKMRLQLNGLSDKAISEYDQSMEKLIKELYELKDKTKELESHVIVEDLVNEINESEINNVIRFRSSYDYYAKLYNEKRGNWSKIQLDSFPNKFPLFSLEK